MRLCHWSSQWRMGRNKQKDGHARKMGTRPDANSAGNGRCAPKAFGAATALVLGAPLQSAVLSVIPMALLIMVAPRLIALVYLDQHHRHSEP